MEECLARVERELFLLREEKQSTERELQQILIPLNVVSECLSVRDTRLLTELIYDDAENELKTELSVIETNQKLLNDQCHSSWEEINRLEQIKSKLILEIENKTEAEKIDNAQRDLDKFCGNLSYKTNPLRVPKE